MDSVKVLKTYVSVTSIDEVSDILQTPNSKSVAICNANTLVQCYKNKILMNKINNFDIKTTDGFPVAKASNILYRNNQKRVDGYNVFIQTIEKGLQNELSHFFYGNSEEITELMIDNLQQKYKDINIAGYYCPPIDNFEKLGKDEKINEIINLNPDVIWVSLGFPKQEEFIDYVKKNHQISANLIGIGAVFEWTAGTKVKAPELLANFGFEWIFRLLQEPRRLFKRYFVDNFLFIIYFTKQFLRI